MRRYLTAFSLATLAILATACGVVSPPAALAQTAPPLDKICYGTGAARACIEAINTVVQSPVADRGLVVTTANVAQQLMPANLSRRGYSVQNQSAGNCYVRGTTATADFHSLKIPAGSYFETPTSHVSTGAVSILCDVSTASVYAREW